MARASMFWLLHIGHLMLPGQSVASAYDAYRTEATLLRSRVTKLVNTTRANLEHARVPVQPEAPNRTPSAEQPPPETPKSPDDSDQPVNPLSDRKASRPVDLNIASNARALHATRSRRHSDRHARGLRTQGKHIGFVVGSGCTYHIHPDVHDLINVRSCSETVSGVNGKPLPCVALGDLPLTVRDSHNNLRTYTLTDVRCVPSMRDSLLSVGQL
eukprot:4439456-Pleurochrysis_carterae.AAC.1